MNLFTPSITGEQRVTRIFIFQIRVINSQRNSYTLSITVRSGVQSIDPNTQSILLPMIHIHLVNSEPMELFKITVTSQKPSDAKLAKKIWPHLTTAVFGKNPIYYILQQ